MRLLQSELRRAELPHEAKTILYPHGSHLSGLMPNRDRDRKLYRMLPLIGLKQRTIGKNRKENLGYYEQSESSIVAWIRNSEQECEEE